MARINVEVEKITKDARFVDLLLELKDAERAWGALLRCWIVAQHYWKFSNNGIPKPEWIRQKLNDALIRCGWADDRGDFISVDGAEKQFAWLRQNTSSGKSGGIESGKSRRGKIDENTKRNEANASETNPLTLPLSQERKNTYPEKQKKQDLDFEIAYQRYPRKSGKKKGLAKCVAKIKSLEDFESLLGAIDSYKKYLEKSGTEAQYVKHFDTFMGCWEDYLDPLCGSVTLKQNSSVNTIPLKIEEIS